MPTCFSWKHKYVVGTEDDVYATEAPAEFYLQLLWTIGPTIGAVLCHIYQ